MGWHILQCDKTIQDNKLHIVVTLLHDQLNVAARGSLEEEMNGILGLVLHCKDVLDRGETGQMRLILL